MFETSSEAYHFLLEHRVINHLESEVYHVLASFHGPANQQMVYRKMKEIHPQILKDTVAPRFATLEAKGVIAIVDKKPCPFTNRATAFYQPMLHYKQREDIGTGVPERKTVKGLEKKIRELEQELSLLRGEKNGQLGLFQREA